MRSIKLVNLLCPECVTPLSHCRSPHFTTHSKGKIATVFALFQWWNRHSIFTPFQDRITTPSSILKTKSPLHSISGHLFVIIKWYRGSQSSLHLPRHPCSYQKDLS